MSTKKKATFSCSGAETKGTRKSADDEKNKRRKKSLPTSLKRSSQESKRLYSEPAVSEPEIGAESPPVKKTKQAMTRFGQENKPDSSEQSESESESPPVKSTARSDNEEMKTAKEWNHLTLAFLKPDKLQDAEKRPLTHPDYDLKTLNVPDSYKRTLTPALKQWWEVKSKHFDTVVFFKVGKFYELYHMDAVIGVYELNLTFTKGEFARCVFPEIAYTQYATSLVERGFKVGQVEQTGIMAMMEKSCKKVSHPFDKVVQHELHQTTSKSTDQTIKSIERIITIAIEEAIKVKVDKTVDECYENAVGPCTKRALERAIKKGF